MLRSIVSADLSQKEEMSALDVSQIRMAVKIVEVKRESKGN